MTKGINYFEISGPDSASLRQFYSQGLDLDLADETDGYTMIAPAGNGAIGGGLFDGSELVGSYAIPYVEVDDVEAAVARAVEAGATVLVPPFEHGPTRAAHIADPAGNRVGLYKPAA